MIEEKRKLKYFEAIREATDQIMEQYPSVFIIGEGVPDPKGVFGTTMNLREKYGLERVLDMPVSENALTGMCIGAALTGMRPIMTHQRIDFALLSLDQIINNAAKWHYMFGGQSSVPIVIRMIIGMGWGQGAQHSQNLQALFAHIPGLKVVMPATAYDAKGLLISSVTDDNPVIFIEHRWLHNLEDYVPEKMYEVPIGKGKIIQEGKDITIAATSLMVIEAIKATNWLKEHNINAEIIDARTIKPLDDDLIISSVKKTGRLLALDAGYYTGGIAGEIIARVSEKAHSYLNSAPQRITLPDIPTPTTISLTKEYYPHYTEIIKKVLLMVGKDHIKAPVREDVLPCDVPDSTFTGPF